MVKQNPLNIAFVMLKLTHYGHERMLYKIHYIGLDVSLLYITYNNVYTIKTSVRLYK